MVKTKEKYKWADRSKHFEARNVIRSINESMKRACDLLEKHETRVQENLLLLFSDQWPQGVVTRFEKDSGTTIPENIYLKVDKE